MSRFATSHVAKTLPPNAGGAKRLTARFGDALVCVRYRIDASTRRRYTTVELVVAESQLPAAAIADVLVRVAYGETHLCQQVKAAGGRWRPDQKLWSLPRPQAKALGPLKRIVKPKKGNA